MRARSSSSQDTPRATIRDIADLAGVSIATVSRVLNGRPDVADETREAVLKIVHAQGFTTNRNARGLSGGRTGLVGMTLPVLHADYFASIVDGAAEALYDHGMRVVLCPTQHKHDREVGLLERLMHGTTDGGLLLLPTESNTELRALDRRGYRFVVIDPREPLAEGIACISATHARGAQDATEHLLGLGHRRIAVITGPKKWVANQQRLNGYHAALAGAGVMPAPDLEMHSDFEVAGGFKAATALLQLDEPPTAIFGFNDALAIGAIGAARALGLNVPDDLSVVGFDDATHASIVTPALTTVRQPLAEMGRMAVSVLLRLFEDERADALRVELATKLVVRDSTAAPR